LLAPSAPAAPRPWYVYYLDARDSLIPARKYTEALRSLEQAVRLKPNSVLQEQTYGLEFIDYLPYYYQAKCYLALGDFNKAILFFNIEETQGQGQVIQRKEALYRDLRKLRADAQLAQSGLDTAEKVRKIAEQVTGLES